MVHLFPLILFYFRLRRDSGCNDLKMPVIVVLSFTLLDERYIKNVIMEKSRRYFNVSSTTKTESNLCSHTILVGPQSKNLGRLMDL